MEYRLLNKKTWHTITMYKQSDRTLASIDNQALKKEPEQSK